MTFKFDWDFEYLKKRRGLRDKPRRKKPSTSKSPSQLIVHQQLITQSMGANEKLIGQQTSHRLVIEQLATKEHSDFNQTQLESSKDTSEHVEERLEIDQERIKQQSSKLDGSMIETHQIALKTQQQLQTHSINPTQHGITQNQGLKINQTSMTVGGIIKPKRKKKRTIARLPTPPESPLGLEDIVDVSFKFKPKH